MTKVEFDTDIDGLEVLEEDECRRILNQERVGRVAVSVGALPAVFPVNYAMAGDELLFFTGEGTKLRAATRNAVVAFEVDHFDPWNKTGWSVMVLGTTREVMEPVVIAGARASGLRPWADGERSHLVSMSVELVSGRRVLPSRHADQPAPPGPNAVVGPHSRVTAVSHRAVRVAATATLQDAADAMRTADVSCVLVDPDTAIVTERDLARALQAGLGPDAEVARVCVGDLVTVEEHATIVDAAGMMLRHEIRHLVVRNHRGGVVGVVSLRDVIAVLLDAMDPAVWAVLRRTLSIRSDWVF